MKYRSYHEQTDIDNIRRLREILASLPPFVRDYFGAMEANTSTKTRLSYAYDIRIFFRFLTEENPRFSDYEPKDFTPADLDALTAFDIEEYKEYLKLYHRDDENGGTDITNSERGMKRKM